MTTADMLSVLTTAPLEYSYFDHGKLGAWAGPKHWKFKPMSKVVQEGEKQKGRKRKEVVQLDYDMYDRGDEDNEELQEVLEKLSLLLTVPKKSVKLVDKTMKGWNRERSTLPGMFWLLLFPAQLTCWFRGSPLLGPRVGQVEDCGQDGSAGRQESSRGRGQWEICIKGNIKS